MKSSGVRLIAVLLGLFFMLAGTVEAHHSVAAEFDIHNLVPMTGKVAKSQLINPHPWIDVDVETPNGVERWKLEFVMSWGSQLKEGETYKFLVAPARSGAKTAYVAELTFPDGRKLSRAS